MDFLKQCVLMDVRGQRPNQIDDISKSINFKNGLWETQIICVLFLVNLKNYRQ